MDFETTFEDTYKDFVYGMTDIECWDNKKCLWYIDGFKEPFDSPLLFSEEETKQYIDSMIAGDW